MKYNPKALILLRSKYRLTSKEMAEIMEVSPKSVYNYENFIHGASPSLIAIQNLCNHFHITPDYFFDREAKDATQILDKKSLQEYNTLLQAVHTECVKSTKELFSNIETQINYYWIKKSEDK